MSNKFLSGGADSGASLTALADGTFAGNMASLKLQDLTPGATLRANGDKLIVSSQIGVGDLNFTPLTNPYGGGDLEVTAGDVIAEDVQTSFVPSLNSYASTTTGSVSALQTKTQYMGVNEGVTTFASDLSTSTIPSVNGSVSALQTKTQYQSAAANKTTFAGDISTSTISSLNTTVTDLDDRITDNGAAISVVQTRTQYQSATGGQTIFNGRVRATRIGGPVANTPLLVDDSLDLANLVSVSRAASVQTQLAQVDTLQSNFSGVVTLNSDVEGNSKNISSVGTLGATTVTAPTVNTNVIAAVNPVGPISVQRNLDFGYDYQLQGLTDVLTNSVKTSSLSSLGGSNVAFSVVSPLTVENKNVSGVNVLSANAVQTVVIENQVLANPITVNSPLFVNGVSIEGASLVSAAQVSGATVAADTLEAVTGPNVLIGASFDFQNTYALLNCPTINGIQPSGGLYSESSGFTILAANLAETNLLGQGASAGSLSVPANGFVALSMYSFKASGVLSGGANDLFTLRAKTVTGIPSTVLLGSIAVQLGDNGLVDRWWDISIDFSIRTTGVAGVAVVVLTGAFRYTNNNDVVSTFGRTFVVSSGFDTTTSNALALTYQNDATNPLTSFRIDQASFTKWY